MNEICIVSIITHTRTLIRIYNVVQVLKNGLKMVKDGAIDSRNARVLFAYQRLSPEELLWGEASFPRKDLLKPKHSSLSGEQAANTDRDL